MRTVGAILAENKGFGKGFDFLRIALSVTIIGWHSLILVHGDRGWYDLRHAWVWNYCLLPMFFGLGGFLIAGSAQRLRLPDFILNRAARIFPALAVETLVSAVLIGFIATTLPLPEYFTHPEFFRYLRNMYGDIVLTLPGVTFLPPYPNVVNGVIWTVPVDLGGYALMVVLILVGLQKRPLFVTSLALFLLAIPTLIVALHADALASYLATAPHLYFLDNVRGSTLIPSFLLGAAAYTVRDRLPWHPAFGLVAVAVLAILGAMGDVSFLHRNFVANVLMCTASVVLMLAIGCADLRRITPPGDYSYGLFLYTFPIQQLVNTNFHVTGAGGFIFHFLASLALGLVFAVFSCHCVEQPMLRWRRQFNLRRRNLAETTRAQAEREAGALRFDSAGRDPGQ